MNGDVGRWNNGLLYAALTVVLGIVGLVAARRFSERFLASGLFLQGVLMTFVVGGSFLKSTTDPKLGGLVIVGLLLVHSVWGPSFAADAQPAAEDEPS